MKNTSASSSGVAQIRPISASTGHGRSLPSRARLTGILYRLRLDANALSIALLTR